MTKFSLQNKNSTVKIFLPIFFPTILETFLATKINNETVHELVIRDEQHHVD